MGRHVFLIFKGGVIVFEKYFVLIKESARRVLKKWFCGQLSIVYLL